MDLSPSSYAHEPVRIPLTDIEDNPYQVRTSIDEAALSALVVSICEVGLLQIPFARKVGDKFQIAFGHRRKKAFERLASHGLSAFEEMPLIVLELTDREMFEMVVTENVKRADLSPIERAQALKQYMMDFGATSEQAAQLFGMKATTVRQTVRLLRLPEEDRQKLQSGKLTPNGARKILKKPATPQAGIDPKDGPFDLRRQLMLLFYDRVRSDVDDELLFKKIRELVELSRQLERQVELMNGRRLKGSKIGSTRRSLQPA